MTDDRPIDESERATAAAAPVSGAAVIGPGGDADAIADAGGVTAARSEAAELAAAKPELLVAGAFAGAFLLARALKRITT